MLRILHIEDSSLDAELVKLRLLDFVHPCSITVATTEEQYLAALQTGEIDLIVSDSSLPGFDTLHALDFAHEHFPQVPFVFLSDNDSPVLKSEALNRGARSFIPKRDLNLLLETIKQLCP